MIILLWTQNISCNWWMMSENLQMCYSIWRKLFFQKVCQLFLILGFSETLTTLFICFLLVSTVVTSPCPLASPFILTSSPLPQHGDYGKWWLLVWILYFLIRTLCNMFHNHNKGRKAFSRLSRLMLKVNETISIWVFNRLNVFCNSKEFC